MGRPNDAGLVAGVDLATASVRVTVADGQGRVRARGAAGLPEPLRPRPGWSEQDADAWWPAAATALREATSSLGRTADAVVAVTVAATSGTVVIADDEGRPLGRALMYDDQRSAAEAETAEEAGEERWTALGWRPGATSGLAKWAWLLSRPDVGPRARWAWHASDVLVSNLVGGPPVTDWSHALKSGYDPGRREWATEATDALGIDGRLLPDVLPPTADVGRVSAVATEATGLPTGCRVRLGMTDGCAAQIAAGADRPGSFATVLGTTMVVKGGAEDLVHDLSGAVYSHRHPDGWWLPGGASNAGGGAVRAAWGADADLVHLDGEAAARGPASCAVYPLTGTGERFPFVAPDAHELWLGEPDDDADRHRALLEGVAFAERLAYTRLGELGARVEGPVRSAGAGAGSAEWSAIRAAVLGRPVLSLEAADTAFGACVLAAAGTLHPDLAGATAAMVGEGRPTTPDDVEVDALDRSFLGLVDALADRGWIDEGLRRGARHRP